MSSDKYVIYGLRRKDSNEYRYIGQTTGRAKNRLNSHSHSAYVKESHYAVHCWMRKYSRDEIVIEVLESCPVGDLDYLNYAERYWISSMRDFGHVLLNHTDGGDGVPGLPAWNRGVPMSEDQKNRLRAANAGRKLSDEHKELISQGVIKHFSSTEQKSVYEYWVDSHGQEEADRLLADLKLKRSQQMSGKGNNMYGRTGQDAPCYGRVGDKHPMFGKTHTAESKAKISVASKGVTPSISARTKRSFSLHEYNHTSKDKFKDTCIWCLGTNLQEEIDKRESKANAYMEVSV